MVHKIIITQDKQQINTSLLEISYLYKSTPFTNSSEAIHHF